MAAHVLIDGNNLVHAVKDHAPVQAVGRETLLRLIERWAAARDVHVTLVFDGAKPRGEMFHSLSPAKVVVRFSDSRTADDVIIELMEHLPDPVSTRVVSSDGAIAYEARRRRCGTVESEAFVAELFPQSTRMPRTEPADPEKPPTSAPAERERWRTLFGGDDHEPFDGADAMDL